MSETSGDTRGHEHTVKIDASPDDVWRAITDPLELARWLGTSAEVDLREGGTYLVRYGEGLESGCEITAVDPGRRLRLEYPIPPDSPLGGEGSIVEEWIIGADGDATILRRVTSGIPVDARWDEFLEGNEKGWEGFLAALRHYVERHFGTDRRVVLGTAALSHECATLWTEVVGPSGLGIESAGAGLAVSEPYHATTAFGASLDGTVVLWDPSHRFLLSVDGLDDALLGAMMTPMGASTFFNLSLSTWGLEADRFEALRMQWEDWFGGRFVGTVTPEEAFKEAYIEGSE